VNVCEGAASAMRRSCEGAATASGAPGQLGRREDEAAEELAIKGGGRVRARGQRRRQWRGGDGRRAAAAGGRRRADGGGRVAVRWWMETETEAETGAGHCSAAESKNDGSLSSRLEARALLQRAP
jgi:hypothetical protein